MRPRGPIFLTNVNLQSTPREGLELLLKLHLREGAWTLAARYNQRMSEARLVRRLVDQSPGLARLVAGNFNATIESDLFRTNWSGFQDCFSEAGQGFGFTKYVHHIGVRIDHIFAGADWVCLDARLWGPKNIGTDHRPLIVDMNWLGTVHE